MKLTLTLTLILKISWRHTYSLIRIKFYCVSNSCFTVISDRFSYHLDRKFGSSWDFCYNVGKRLLEGSRVQSRFRDTRTMPYAYWGSECQSERAPAGGENAFWSRVLDCGRETEVCRSTDKICKRLSKWPPLEGKSCHLARKEWFFYSTRQLFNEIAILWRNSAILNDDESTTTKVIVRVQMKSEKRKGPVKNNVDGDCQCHDLFWSSCDVWHAISDQ